MMLCTPLIPKAADGVLRVILPGRISTPGQDERNIESTQEEAEQWLRQVFSGPIEIRRLGERASGWLVDRDTMVVARELIISGWPDVVLATEIREIYRNPAEQWKFAFECVDNDVRLILLHDYVDTADEDWINNFFTASLRAGMTVPETRRRVRRKAGFSFSRGGMVLKVKYGYRKPTAEEAASGKFGSVGLRIAKLSEFAPTIKEICRRIRADQSYVQIADFLNDEGILPGRHVQSGKWTGRLVKALLCDAILSGARHFRAVVHTLVYRTGKHRRDRNPAGPTIKEYSELAHISKTEHAEVLAVMVARESQSKAGQRKGKDSPLWRRPRSRSIWPGQHAICKVCGGLMYR